MTKTEDIKEWCLKMKQIVPPCHINSINVIDFSILEKEYFTTNGNDPTCEFEILVEYGGDRRRPLLRNPIYEGNPIIYWNITLNDKDISKFSNRLLNIFPQQGMPLSPLEGKELRISKKPNFQSMWKMKGPRNEGEQKSLIKSLIPQINIFFAEILALPQIISKSRLVLELFLPPLSFNFIPSSQTSLCTSTLEKESPPSKIENILKPERDLLLKLIYNNKKSLILYKTTEDLKEKIKKKFDIPLFKNVELQCKDDIDDDFVIIDCMDDLESFIDFRQPLSSASHLSITIVDQ